MSEAWLKTRRRLIGVVFLAVLALLIALSVAVYNKTFTSDTMVTLSTDSTGNEMNLNADVMVRGVVVGYVRSITANGNGATLGLAITPSVASSLPANVTAQLLPTTLFGQRYVNLVAPAQPSAQTLADARVIGQDRSADAIELEKVLNDLYPMLTAVQPAKLSVTLTAVADALSGNGTQLGQTLDQINGYLKQFNPQLPALDADIRALVQVTQAYAQAAPGIVQSLHDFTVTSQTIAADASNLTSLYSTVTATSQNLTTFLTSNEQDIIRLSADSQPTLNTLARYSAEFPCVFEGLTQFETNINKVLGAGTSQPGIHVTVHPVQSLGKYLPVTDAPRYGDNMGAHCYAASFSGIKLNDGAGQSVSTAKGSTAPTGTVPAAGLGPANSPQENELINELVSPSVNVPPDNLPSWSSVLLGPIYRGTAVKVG
jgi:phospholipid/cholesterol/gamma-HCH transport system substrate-binding protein